MSENLRRFTEAVYAFDAVVRRVDDGSWSASTPCEEWTASDLLQHQCAVLNGVTAMATSGEMARPTPPEDMSDPQATWIDTRDRLFAALDRQGALAQEGPFWFDSATIDDVTAAVMWDPVTHAWDLAQATGQPHGLSDSLVQAAYDTVAPRSDMLVETGRTGAVLDSADDAPILDRYLALVGRTSG